MRPMWAYRSSLRPAEIHPALRSFADECTAVMGRLLAYIGALALIAIAGSKLFAVLSSGWDTPAVVRPSWSVASRSSPAFAVTRIDPSLKTETYDILRHPGGGRKDVLRWMATPDGKPIVELEIYRPGSEERTSEPPIADLVARMDPGGVRPVEAAGLIDSKFGPIRLVALAGDANPCLGFLKSLDNGNLRLSGWSCQAANLPERRVAIGCLLDRLILLSAGNGPKLAELFAHAELQRGSCASAASKGTVDWVAGTQNPELRGRL